MIELKDLLEKIDNRLFETLKEAIKATEEREYRYVAMSHKLQHLLRFRRNVIDFYKELEKLNYEG